MNTSIQDAFNLAWKLAYVMKGHARPDLLDTYNVERHPVAESLLSGTDRAYTRLLKAGDLAKYAVRTLGPTLLASDTIRNKMREVLEEIGINYRKGPITGDFGGSSGPAAGDRALDATVVDLPSQESKPLRDFFRRGHWTLLGFSGRSASDAEINNLSLLLSRITGRYDGVVKAFVIAGGLPVRQRDPRVLLDPMLQAHEQFGVISPCLYLIRPDWYIGFRGAPDKVSQLEANLDRYLVAVDPEAAHAS